jgi:hypothetical protein
MKFDKDIIISYAHIDDAPLIEGQKGWISEFHRSLEIRLAQLLGKKPKIWRDPKLQGNDYFSDEILSQLPQIALLISVLSPRYVKSEWCLKEVSKFYEASVGNIGIRIKNKSRVFKIIKTPVKREEHPESIRDLLGYEFYRLDPETGRAKELSRIFGVDNEQAYWQKLDDLAHDISELLDTLSADEDGTVDSKQTERKSIYLAETTFDLRESREIVRRELQQHGYTILPDQQIPLVAADYINTTRDLLKQSILSIHLIGSSYGIIPEGTRKSVIELQNEIAGEVSLSAGLQRLIWIGPNVKTDDQRQTEFVKLLRTDSAAQAGADLLVTSLEEVKLTIHDKLKRKVEKKAVDDVIDSVVRIYIVCDRPDLENVTIKMIADYLFQRRCEVILPVFDGDEAQVRIEHQENLKSCTGVIVCYGSGNELWLRSKLRDLIKVAGYGRTSPLRTKAVYLVGPSTAQKEGFRSHEVTVINGLNGFDEAPLQEFIEKAQQG